MAALYRRRGEIHLIAKRKIAAFAASKTILAIPTSATRRQETAHPNRLRQILERLASDRD
jgi:DNA-binding LytR/AlgR family response regulator